MAVLCERRRKTVPSWPGGDVSTTGQAQQRFGHITRGENPMSLYLNYRRFGFVLAVLSLLVIQVAPVQAAMLGNSDLLQRASGQIDRQQIKSLIEREDVQQQLIALGVDTAAAAERVDRMTDAEIAQINQRIAEMPAGGSSVLGVLLIIFIVFVITDVLGATDIFPFIKPIK